MNPVLLILQRVPVWVWIVLALALVALILRGPITRAMAAIKQLAMRDGGDYSGGVEMPAEQVTALAQEAYTQLTAGVVSPTARETALLAILDGTNDSELRAVAKRYKLLSRDRTLYQAIDSAWMPFSDVDERLMSRLANIAMI